MYKQIRTIYTWNWTCQVHTINHSFGLKKLAPCKNFSWLLNWHLAIFLAPTFWEPEQPLINHTWSQQHFQTDNSAKILNHVYFMGADILYLKVQSRFYRLVGWIFFSKVAFCENKLLALAAMLNFRLALKAQILIRYTK